MKREWDVMCILSDSDIANDLELIDHNHQIISIFTLRVFLHIFRLAEASLQILYIQVGHTKYLLSDDTVPLSPIGVVSVT